MSLIVTHNLSAMQTQRNMSNTSRGLSKSLEKLSSGYRINVGADDPSGLVISEQLRSQISGTQRAIRNTSEAANLIGLTEGALIEMNEILKKMRQLAIHSANSGVTSPEQVKANQAEVDSGIATLDRIANTTAYSDQYVLNGSKQLVYDRLTLVKNTMNHSLINMEASRVDQIFKKDGVSMTFGFAGQTADGYVNDSAQAKKAYLEADRLQPDPHSPGNYIKSEAQYDENGYLTATQEFILTGTKGTKLFKFASGTHLGTIADSINNIKDSLGVGATLTFGSDARIDITGRSIPHTDLVYNYDQAGAPTNAVTDAAAGSQFSNTSISVDMTGIIDNGNWLGDVFGFNGIKNQPLTGTLDYQIIKPSTANDPWTMKILHNGEEIAADVVLGDLSTSPPATQTVTVASGPLTGATITVPKVTAANFDTENAITSGTMAFTFNPTEKAAALWDGRTTGDVQIYGANLNGGPTEAKVSGVHIANPDDFRAGLNCDGDGRVYAKVTKFIDVNNYEVEWYKDKDCTMLIGSSSSPTSFSATNSSGISSNGLTIKLTNSAQVNDVYTVGLVGQEFTFARDSDGVGGIDQPADFNVEGIDGWVGMTEKSMQQSVVSGVKLGYNTSSTGDLYFKCTGPANDRIIQVFKDASMNPASLVASGRANLTADPAATPPGNSVIRLEEVMMDNGQMSGLNMTMNFSGGASSGLETGKVTFTNVALRMYSTDYGSDEMIRIQNREGQLFHQFRFGDSTDREMVPVGATVQVNGQDAKISMNGFPVTTKGLIANITTPDFQAMMAFNGGVLGLTTIAQAGYEIGSLFSRAQALQAIPEDERRIRQVQLSQGYEIIPATTNLENIKGLATTVDEIPNSGDLKFDFTGIDTTQLTAAQLEDLQAALQGGLSIRVLPPTTPGTTSVNLEITYNRPNGQTSTRTLADVSFADLNSTEGYTPTAADGIPGILAGLNIKGNQLSSNVALPAAANAETFRVMGDLTEPAYEPLGQVFTYATNARHATDERLDNFIGGMQFQLGGNEGDQDRTVYSIPSMVMANVGRLEWDGKVYTLQDVLDGGEASLTTDPILAMRIISQAVDDVSTLRGRLGAFQSNMLQTNQNSLEVAVEMLTKTESAIRDTDMAEASTEFTKNQILMQAGTAMLAQANQINQNVLQLLG